MSALGGDNPGISGVGGSGIGVYCGFVSCDEVDDGVPIIVPGLPCSPGASGMRPLEPLISKDVSDDILTDNL